MRAFLRLVSLVLASGCAHGPERGEDVSRLGRVLVVEPPTANANDGGESLDGERGCPSGSVWRDRRCIAPGFVACRPGEVLGDDGCARPAYAAVDAAAPAPSGTGRVIQLEEMPNGTGLAECDRFIAHYARCLRKSMPTSGTAKLLEDTKRSYRIILSSGDPKLREQIRQSCEVANRALPKQCP